MPGPVPAATVALQRPASCTALFVVFTRMALQGFGGVLPVAQRELVERERWVTREHFLEMLALSQVLPGPNVVNLALMVGQRFFGQRGALAAMAGILLAPLVLVLALAILAAQWQHHAGVTAALRGMGIVAAGLIVATALKLAATLKHNPLGRISAALLITAAFLAIGVLRWPLLIVVLGLGGGAWAWGLWQLRATPGANDGHIEHNASSGPNRRNENNGRDSDSPP
jgi:chromate transporter